jgi:hypothetical protein
VKLSLVLCTAAVLLGSAALIAYSELVSFSGTASPPEVGPEQWPRDSKLERVPGQRSLVIFAHPRCACTDATLAEISRLLTVVRRSGSAYPSIVLVANLDDDTEHTPLLEAARAVPGLSLFRDTNATEAQRFKVSTSGTTLLFSATGDLLFRGGVTGARGHHGDNYGATALGL